MIPYIIFFITFVRTKKEKTEKNASITPFVSYPHKVTKKNEIKKITNFTGTYEMTQK